MKDENNEPQMTIEMDGELMDEQVQKVSEDELPATLKRMKESASEGDEAPVGSLSLKQIVGSSPHLAYYAYCAHHNCLCGCALSV